MNHIVCGICKKYLDEDESVTKLDISWDRGDHGRYLRLNLCPTCYHEADNAISMALTELKLYKRSDIHGKSYNGRHEGTESETR